MYDIIVVGAGPAGVSAALYAKSRGFSVLLLEKDEVGGLIKGVSHVTHYVGLDENESGDTFREKLENQIADADIELKYEEVIGLDLKFELKKVKTKQNSYNAKAVILAMGSTPKDLGLENEKEIGVEHSALGLDEEIEDRIIFVAGGSDGAAKEALYLSKLAKKVYLIEERDELGMIDEFREKIEASDNIEAMTSSKIVSASGTRDKITEVCIYDSAEKEEKLFENGEDEFLIFAYIGQRPNTELIKDSVEMAGPYIKTDGVKTSIPGVFACGDIIDKKIRQIATAVAEGCTCAIEAQKYLGY